ncbi:MAG: Rne/Rng family ribonuclease [Bacteroidota bacterium]
MNNELIITFSSSEVIIALLADKRLIEMHREKVNAGFAVGDILLGSVKKNLSGLNASFIDVGHEKDAFLHYLDLGSKILSFNKFVNLSVSGEMKNSSIDDFQMEKDIAKTGKIAKVLSLNQKVLVQIMKEPISNKGPRLTSHITLPGRFLVLMPFADNISISQKIRKLVERDRLRQLVESIKPKNFGVIIRTVAENQNVMELDTDLKDLMEKWNKMWEALKGAIPPKVVLGEMNRSMVVLRDILNASFQNIYIDNQKLYNEIKSYLQTIAPDKVSIVKHYKGVTPIFEHFGIDKQIKSSFGKTVSLKSGGYLIIEHTEALHVIDVNSGRTHSNKDQESNALTVNMEAAEEVARQLRLRDIGGIIVVDFIDLRNTSNKRDLYNKMKEAMHTDPATHTVLPPSRFGLVQITRERIRPQLSMKTTEKCPSCGGSGEVQSSILLLDQIEKDLNYLVKEQNQRGILLTVHPFIDAYLNKGLPTIRHKWFLKYRRKIKVKAVTSHHILEYHFFNKNEEEIEI